MRISQEKSHEYTQQNILDVAGHSGIVASVQAAINTSVQRVEGAGSLTAAIQTAAGGYVTASQIDDTMRFAKPMFKEILACTFFAIALKAHGSSGLLSVT